MNENLSIKQYPVSEPDITAADISTVTRAMQDGWVSGDSPIVSEFEKRFADYCGRKYGVCCSSGSAALDLSVQSLGWGKGDEIIVPSFTIISTISQCIRNGCSFKFIDSDPVTWNVNIDDLLSAVSTNTKGIIIPHIYGICNDMEKLALFCKERNIQLLEDAAEVHGQKYPDSERISGSLGDLSSFSFYSNKIITTGEGGIVLTDSQEIYTKLKYYRNLCFNNERRFFHEHVGWNYRLNSMSASLGISQLSRIDKILEKKRNIGDWYKKYFEKHSDYLDMQPSFYKGTQNIFWVNGFLIKQGVKLNREKLMQELSSLNVGSRPFFCPLHKQNLQLNIKVQQSLPVAEHLGSNGFYLPSSNTLTEEDVFEISNRFDAALRRLDWVK